jgi:hypothetical protein
LNKFLVRETVETGGEGVKMECLVESIVEDSIACVWKNLKDSKISILKGFEFSTTAKKFSIGFPQKFPHRKNQGFPLPKFDLSLFDEENEVYTA